MKHLLSYYVSIIQTIQIYPNVQFQIYGLINRKQPGKLSQHCLFDKTRSLRVPVKIYTQGDSK